MHMLQKKDALFSETISNLYQTKFRMCCFQNWFLWIV